MAIGKRLRYEILKRDGFRCRYCGAKATEGSGLTIDHVTRQAVGGTDEPSNLKAACFDCNAGKSSTLPDADTIDETGYRVVEWAEAARSVHNDFESAKERMDGLIAAVKNEWLTHYEIVDKDIGVSIKQRWVRRSGF